MSPIKNLQAALCAGLAFIWVIPNAEAIKYLPSQSLALAEANLSIAPANSLWQDPNVTSKSLSIPNTKSQKKSKKGKKSKKKSSRTKKGTKSRKASKRATLSLKLPV